MVWDTGPTDGPKKDGIERLQLFKPIFGHHRARVQIGLAGPVEVLEFDAEAETLGEYLGNLNASWDDFLANTISGDGGDAIVCHADLLQKLE